MDNNLPIFVLGGLLTFLLARLAFYLRKDLVLRSTLPPGPPSHWLFGTTVPTSNDLQTFESWATQYGPVYTIRQGVGQYLIVITDYDDVMELMEKQGATNADRPRYVAGGEIVSGGMRTLIRPMSPELKRLRKVLHVALQPRVVQGYTHVQEKNGKQVVLDILEEPDKFFNHAERFSSSTILEITYGNSSLSLLPSDITPDGSSREKLIARIHYIIHRFGFTMRPGAYLVDTFPVLKYAPEWLYRPLRDLRQWHLEELHLFSGMVQGVRNTMDAAGSFKPGHEDASTSFTAHVLDYQGKLELSDNEVAYLCGSMFGAGSDTTAAAIKYIVMAAACFPQQQARVQEELDTVLGKNRAPCAEDAKTLLLVVAFYLESYRWRPVSQAGVAHRTTQDMRWRQWTIPAGASVLGHHWLIGRSPDLFPDPEEFDISRWIVEQNGERAIRDDIKAFIFGFGRRICPGLHLANKSLFITTALLLWAFKISEVPEEKIDTMKFTKSFNAHPLPFKVRFEPRRPVAEIRRMLRTE